MIDTSRKHEIKELVDVDLRKNEDSVTSLAILQSLPGEALVYAGINSSTADQNAGKNEHLRSFRIPYPRRRKGSSEDQDEVDEKINQGTEALGRHSLFVSDVRSKKETYQRVLRLSPPGHERGLPRLSAIASGLAEKSEVVVFDSALSPLGSSLPPPSLRNIHSIDLGQEGEAGDVDIRSIDPDSYRVAFCTDYSVQVVQLCRGRQEKRATVYSVPHPDTFASAGSRPKLRSVRFLTGHLILILQNHPNRSGTELLLLELLPHTLAEGDVILQRRMRKSVKSATALTICELQPQHAQGMIQSVVAVAGQDNSITILTLDHPRTPSFGKLRFREYAFLRDTHPLLLTTLAFAYFHPPTGDAVKAPAQYIKLASTSMANTVVVHTLPLSPFPAPDTRKPVERYVLVAPGHDEAWQMTMSVIISAIVIAIGAFFLQAFTEVRGGTPEYLGAKTWLPERIHGWVARPYMFENVSSLASTASATAASGAGSASGTIMDTVDDIVKSAIKPATSVTSEGQASASSMKQQAQSSIQSASHHIASLIHSHHQAQATPSSGSSDSSGQQAVLISHDPESNSLHAAQHEADVLTPDGKHQATRWEHLPDPEKQKWIKRLADAGHLAEAQAEAVLKGVFFSSIGQIIGAAVG